MNHSSVWLPHFGPFLVWLVVVLLVSVPLVQGTRTSQEPPLCEGCDDATATTRPPQSQDDYKSLAQYWAPRIYQDTDDSYYLGDYITKINFDGDYNSLNNWENLANFDTVPPYVYYSVSETLTHYFIFYGVFHPRDWHEWLAPDQHENDFEGIMLCVQKANDGSSFGTLVAMETQAHDQFYQYKADGQSVTNGSDTVDGTIETYEHRPKIFIEAKGHGIYNCDSRCSSAPGGDGIIYYEGHVAESPSSGSGNWLHTYSYKLIAMDASSGDQGLWHRRHDICTNGCTYAKWGVMRGDNYGSNKANLPFIWDDANDGEVYSGDMLCDPAYFFDAHLNGGAFASDSFSHTYVNHIYRTHQIRVTRARSDKGRDPFGGDSDIYVQVEVADSAAGTNKIMDARNWKKNDAHDNEWYPWYFGGYDAEGQRSWSQNFNTKSFCRQHFNAHVTVKIMDSDNNADDFMGSIVLKNGSASYLDGIDLGDGRVAFELTTF